MATIVVVFKILFLVLIAHSFVAISGAQAYTSQPATGAGLWTAADSVRLEDQESAATVTLESVVGRSHQEEPTETGAAGREPPRSKPPPPPLELERRLGEIQPAGGADNGAARQTPAAPSQLNAAVNYAELCYLSDGGSSITLTVNEATQVGSIIGAVEVNGDPSLENGNVDLFDALDTPQWASARSSQDSATATTQPNAADSSVAPQKQRRILGRRSTSGEQLLASEPGEQAKEQGQWPLLLDRTGGSRLREARSLLARGPHSAPPPPTPSSDHHAASFYSLVAGSPTAQTQATLQAGASQQQQQPAVRLDPGTRNLILVRSLDKESVEGEQSLVVNVRCSPRARADSRQPGKSGTGGQQQQESTTIPVRIIVTDANDHAPEFVGPQPYVVNISETTPIGAVVARDILALDRDSAGPHSTLHYRVLEDGTAHSSLLQFANPLDPTLVVAGQLDYETLSSFTITIVAQDQGEPEPLSASAQVQVNVIDFDDQNPRFLDDKYSLIMDESQQSLVGQNLQVLPRNLYAEDGDRGIGAPILYSFDQLAGFRPDGESPTADSTEPGHNIERYLHLNPSSGEIRLIRQWPSRWLAAPVTLVVRATQADNRDRYTLTTLTIAPNKPAAAATLRPALTPTSSNRAGAARASDEWTSSESGGSQAQPQQGIEFAPDRLSIDVAENVPINEKIARVKAKLYLGPGLQTSDGQQVESQVVDLVAPASGSSSEGAAGSLRAVPLAAANGTKQASKRTRVAELQQANKRPINYQILDDQTDQFGINGLGEIFVKRPLDYEQRQEYKFRVLATYTKFSDICQVLVNVLNVNDNKPKFTQPQYTFHLTESRLRSNTIGTVQAHDADLNDTIQYTLLGEHAHLFDISQQGQLSLKPDVKQLNITNCQLVAQANDSLGPGPAHTHQARINLQVAPQLVGRPINLAERSMSPPPVELSKLFNSRSLVDHSSSGAGWLPNTQTNRLNPNSRQLQQEPVQASSQRSSVATVVASFQHMMRGVSLFDMPVSSALLLAALLAFLVCLLFIVIISMSVHFYRRRTKSRHRHQLATATRLRHAHMAALQGGSPAGDQPRYQGSGGHSTPIADGSAGSPSGHLSPAGAAKLRQQLTSPEPNPSAPKGALAAGFGQLNSATAKAARNRPRSASSVHSARKSVRASPLEELSAQLEAAAAATARSKAESSLISSLSSQSKRSYRSNTTDDSSVMHCGHYSVTGSQFSPSLKATSAAATATAEPGKHRVSGYNSLSPELGGGNNLGYSSSPESPRLLGSLNTPIALKIQPNELTVLTGGSPGVKSYRKLPHLGSLVRPIRTNRVGDATAAEQAVRAMRRTPSQPAVGQVQSAANQQSQATRQRQDLQDSAIASDASSSVGSGIAQQHQLQKLQQAPKMVASAKSVRRTPERRTTPLSGGVRSPQLHNAGQHSSGEHLSDSPRSLSPPPPPMDNIRWPRGSIPQRVKKLTWDDELGANQAADDFYSTQPEISATKRRLMSPVVSHHQYPLDTSDQQHHYSEQHFLFSNPCSPIANLVSTDFTSSGAAATGASGCAPAASLNSNKTQVYGSNNNGSSSSMAHVDNQENCFDYTIVQSSQLRLEDSLGERFHQQPHLLHQNHARFVASPGPTRATATSSYLYSTSNSNGNTSSGDSSLSGPVGSHNAAPHNHRGQQLAAAAANQPQDLRLMTTAVL